MSLRFKQTDSAEVIRYTALDARKQPVNLIGTTVRFLMAKRDAAGVAVNEPAVVTDGMSGKIEYRPSDSAMLQAGVFNAEFHVEWPDGRRKIYPSDGYLQITIAPSLDVNQPGVIEEQIVMRITAIEEFKDEIVAEVDGFRGELVGVEQATTSANQAAGRANDAADIAAGRVAELEGLDVVQLDGRVSEVSAQLVEKASQRDLETEKERINNLVANAGNTDGNAELLDIRVGFDGVTYDTAGEAVRAIGTFLTSDDENWEV